MAEPFYSRLTFERSLSNIVFSRILVRSIWRFRPTGMLNITRCFILMTFFDKMPQERKNDTIPRPPVLIDSPPPNPLPPPILRYFHSARGSYHEMRRRSSINHMTRFLTRIILVATNPINGSTARDPRILFAYGPRVVMRHLGECSEGHPPGHHATSFLLVIP